MSHRPIQELLPVHVVGKAFELAVFGDDDLVHTVTHPSFDHEFLDCSMTPEQVGSIEDQLYGFSCFSDAPESERNVALLALLLNLRRTNGVSNVAVPDAISRRACELIRTVQEDFPDFITEPRVWNCPAAGVVSTGTLVRELLFADIDVRPEWVGPNLYGTLVREAGAQIALSAPLASTMNVEVGEPHALCSPVSSRHLLVSAGWMCENNDFLSDLALSMNAWMPDARTRLLALVPIAACDVTKHNAQRGVVNCDSTPRAARRIIARLGDRHPGIGGTQVLVRGGDHHVAPRVAIAELAKAWISAIRQERAHSDIVETVHAIGSLCNLTPDQAVREFASCVVDTAYSGVDGVGLALVLDKSNNLLEAPDLMPLLSAMVDAGIAPMDRPLYTAEASAPSLMLDHFIDALVARFGPFVRQPFEVLHAERAMSLTIQEQCRQAGQVQGSPSVGSAAVAPARRRRMAA